MADSFVSKLITELTAKTTAADTDLIPIADSNGNFFKMTWQKMKQLLLGTKDISGVGDGTVTGAISELNTKIYIISDNIDNLSLMNKVENYSSFAITYRGWESRYVPDRNNSFFLCSKDSIICISLSGKMYKCERRNLNWIQM